MEMDRKAVTWEEDSGGGVRMMMMMSPTDKLQQLLRLQLQLCHREGWPAEIVPNADMYNRVLKRLAWQSASFRTEKDGDDDETGVAEQAWLWLQLMQRPLPSNCESGEECATTLCQPNAMTYANVIEALSSYRAPIDSESTEMDSFMENSAMPAYESMDTLAEQLDMDMIQSSRTDNSPEWFLSEAENLLVILEEEFNRTVEEDTDVLSRKQGELKRALAHSYRCLLEGWGRYAVAGVSSESRGNSPSKLQEHAVKRAYKLLGRLEALAEGEKEARTDLLPPPQSIIVPSSCYSSVILALSISDSPKAADVSENVLQRMISQYGIDEPSRTKHIPLQASFFNPKHAATAFSGCIAAHAKNNDAPKAEEILNQMVDLYDGRKLGREFVPEVRAFGTCIALWSKYTGTNSLTRDGRGGQRRQKRGKYDLPSFHQRIANADRTEAILSELERIAKIEANKDSGRFVLHATPYNIAILARVQTIAKSDPKSSRNRHDDDYLKEENEEILLHAQDILDHMEYKMGVTPDPYTYSILLHAWCQQSCPGNEKAADYAECLLRRRIEDVDISKLYGDDIAIKSPVKSFENEIWPNVKHYSSVLKAHAKTKSAGGAKKALGLLSEMERRFYAADDIDDTDNDNDETTRYHVDQKNSAKPDLVCYSIVIDAFANSRLPEASSVAHRLLRAVETKYDAGDDSVKPNTRIYTAVILSLVHAPLLDEESENDSETSGEKMNNAQRAWSILERMKDNDAPPNSFTYNYIINCASQSGHTPEDQKLSFEVALRAFQELRKASSVEPDFDGCVIDLCHPDSFTYAFMLKACNNLLPPGPLSDKVISQTFKECCRCGYLNDAVLDRLWHGVSMEIYLELLEQKPKTRLRSNNGNRNKSPIRASDLPMPWGRCCNSVKRRSRNRENNSESSWKEGVKFAIQ